MDRSPLSILLAVMIALQASLTGYALCSEGGCCHAGPASDHRGHEDHAAPAADPAHGHEGCHGDHEGVGLVAHAGHSTLVDADEAHRCDDCTDLEIDGDDAVRVPRDESIVVGSPAPVPCAVLAVSGVAGPLERPFLSPVARTPAIPPIDLAVVRTTRLLL